MQYAIGGEANYYQPPDPPKECAWCDGQGAVEVAAIYCVLGKTHDLEREYPEVKCPRCGGSGDEPEQEDPRIP